MPQTSLLTSFMVKATRSQSNDPPSLFIWAVIFSWYLTMSEDKCRGAETHESFHSQTFSKNFSRP
jgi:hypothetical protein